MIGDKLSPLQLSVIEIFLESVDKVADNAAVLSERLLSYILIEQVTILSGKSSSFSST
jgi:hypothetical protein